MNPYLKSYDINYRNKERLIFNTPYRSLLPQTQQEVLKNVKIRYSGNNISVEISTELAMKKPNVQCSTHFPKRVQNPVHIQKVTPSTP
jgi:predicted transglutaminase-like protease